MLDNKVDYDEAAIHFMKNNEEMLKGWMPADKFAKVKKALAMNKTSL